MTGRILERIDMAITIPSDLVLDVMRGADPGRLKMAAAKFTKIPEAPAAKGMAFPDVMSGLPDGPSTRQPQTIRNSGAEAGPSQHA